MKKLQLRLTALIGLSLLSAALLAGCGHVEITQEDRIHRVSNTEQFYRWVDETYGSSLSQDLCRYKPNQAVGLD